jgi:hypothetical protein
LSLLRYSLGTRSVISALDLCTAAVWRLSDGQPLSGGKEQDLDGAFLKWAQLTPGRMSQAEDVPCSVELRWRPDG